MSDKLNPLGGRPKDAVWKNVIVIKQSDKHVTCKTCGEKFIIE